MSYKDKDRKTKVFLLLYKPMGLYLVGGGGGVGGAYIRKYFCVSNLTGLYSEGLYSEF